jgi:hypothetical protein
MASRTGRLADAATAFVVIDRRNGGGVLMSGAFESGLTGTSGPRAARWPAGLVAVGIAAAATTLIAAVGRSLGVPLAIDGKAIPLIAFTTFTVIGGVMGVALAGALNRWARRPRRTFAVTAVVLTVLSLVPDLLVQVSTGSRILMMLTHLAAAIIVVPTLSRRLPVG